MAKTDTRTPARSKTPIFDAMIEEARRAPRDTDISLEELDRRLAITDEERRAAQADVERWLREDAEDEAAQVRENTAPKNGASPSDRARRKGAKQ